MSVASRFSPRSGSNGRNTGVGFIDDKEIRASVFVFRFTDSLFGFFLLRSLFFSFGCRVPGFREAS